MGKENGLEVSVVESENGTNGNGTEAEADKTMEEDAPGVNGADKKKKKKKKKEAGLETSVAEPESSAPAEVEAEKPVEESTPASDEAEKKKKRRRRRMLEVMTNQLSRLLPNQLPKSLLNQLKFLRNQRRSANLQIPPWTNQPLKSRRLHRQRNQRKRRRMLISHFYICFFLFSICCPKESDSFLVCNYLLL